MMVFRWPLNTINDFIFCVHRFANNRNVRNCFGVHLCAYSHWPPNETVHILQMKRTTGIAEALFVFQIFSICKSFICLTVSFSCTTFYLHRLQSESNNYHFRCFAIVAIAFASLMQTFVVRVAAASMQTQAQSPWPCALMSSKLYLIHNYDCSYRRKN